MRPSLLTRLTIVFIVGVFTGRHLPIPFFYPAAIFFAFTMLFFYLHFSGKKRYLLISLPYFLLFILGYLSISIQQERFRREQYLTETNKIESYFYKIKEVRKRSDNKTTTTGTILKIKKDDWQPAEINCWVSFYQKEGLEVGQVVLIKGYPEKVKAPKDKYAFDFESFLETKHIAYSDFVFRNEVYSIFSPDTKSFLSGFKTRFLSTIDQNVPSAKAAGMLKAMICGDRSSLHSDVQDTFAKAGVLHVLAVSGLHVGILYVLFAFLLRLLPFFGKKEWLRAFILIAVIWFYALFTGFSASVVRAAIMFSLFAMGEVVNKRPSSFTLLSASALLVLILDPMQLFTVSFQLSYSAVAGILLFFPSLYAFISSRYKPVNYVWGIVCVSIAAQAGTLPVSLHYFHYLPVFSLITNIIVIPASFIFVSGGLLLVLFSFIPSISSFIGICLSWLYHLIEKPLNWLTSFEISGIQNIYLDRYQMIMITIILVCIAWVLKNKNRKSLSITVITLSVFFIYDALDNIQSTVQSKIRIETSSFYLLSGRTLYLNPKDEIPVYAMSKNFRERISLDKLQVFTTAETKNAYYFINDTVSCILSNMPVQKEIEILIPHCHRIISGSDELLNNISSISDADLIYTGYNRELKNTAISHKTIEDGPYTINLSP